MARPAPGALAAPAPIEVIRPANRLRTKIGPPRPQIPDLIDRAEAALLAMTDDYLCWVAQDIDLLQGEATRAEAGDAVEHAAALQAIHGIAHDIKGQGGTFGFILVTWIAASLCRYLESRAEDGRADPAILGAHIDALRVVVRNGIRGDGGAIGTELVRELAEAIERSRARAGETDGAEA
jgi:hypothetical protein